MAGFTTARRHIAATHYGICHVIQYYGCELWGLYLCWEEGPKWGFRGPEVDENDTKTSDI